MSRPSLTTLNKAGNGDVIVVITDRVITVVKMRKPRYVGEQVWVEMTPFIKDMYFHYTSEYLWNNTTSIQPLIMNSWVQNG